MPNHPAGATWLRNHFGLKRHVLTHASFIGQNPSLSMDLNGHVEQVYGSRYDPGNSISDHLVFYLKYDHLSLDFLKDVFAAMSAAELLRFIHNSPGSKYARKLGFLYEFLTGDQLPLETEISGNYVDIVDPEKYITGKSTRNQRWRINDNLLGGPDYCPIVRRTPRLTELLQVDITEKINALKIAFSPEIFQRASDYLYRKETRSSFEIEHETPSPDRMARFVALLMRAGSVTHDMLLDEKRLTDLQHAIVDTRFAAKGFRDFQNYIGQSLPNFREIVHYVCPPPDLIPSLTSGIRETALRSIGVPSQVRAAVLAFGFVFIHPFEDGNGRIHRFLIHDILAKDGLVPAGMIIPVSAHMVNHRREYDTVLERYSAPLMQFACYEYEPKGALVLTNPDEMEGYFRYPDLTDHAEYLAGIIAETLTADMREELLFLQRYDEAKQAILQIVDMPDKMIDQIILFLHQNKGLMPKRRRAQFHQLTDSEISRMEATFREVFELPGQG